MNECQNCGNLLIEGEDGLCLDCKCADDDDEDEDE